MTYNMKGYNTVYMLQSILQEKVIIRDPDLYGYLKCPVLWFTQLVSHGELMSRWRVSVVLYFPSED
jgi:hypothetical protein